MGRASRRKKDPKPKEVKGRMAVLRLLRYHGVNVYIRKIDEDIVEYLVPINNEVYSDYMIFKPVEGHKSWTEEQQHAAVQTILAGAFATIEGVLGIEPDKRETGMAEEFIKAGDKAWGDDNVVEGETIPNGQQ